MRSIKRSTKKSDTVDGNMRLAVIKRDYRYVLKAIDLVGGGNDDFGALCTETGRAIAIGIRGGKVDCYFCDYTSSEPSEDSAIPFDLAELPDRWDWLHGIESGLPTH